MIFLLLIPTQLGRHFWPEWSYVLGMRIDYLSPTLYLIDLVWIIIFLFFGFKPSVSRLRNISLKKGDLIKFSCLGLFIMINILVAGNKWLAGYKWLRVGQFLWMVWYLRKQNLIKKGRDLFLQKKGEDLFLRKGGDLLQKKGGDLLQKKGGHIGPPVQRLLKWIIPIWIVFESLLGWGQVIKGGSLEGLFYWLGERRFDFNTIGIAQFSFLGHGLVRAYGTFSHPNSLAGFLLVSLIIWQKNPLFRDCETSPLKREIFNWIIIWLGIVGIILTGSRVVIVFGILYMVFSMFKPSVLRTSPLKRAIILFLGIGFLILFFRSFSGWDGQSWQKRMNLNISALEMIKHSPIFGVGLGNFLVELPKYQKNQIFWLQPVHNIFLLILSEVGIGGVVVLVFGLRQNPPVSTKVETPSLKKGGLKLKYFWVWMVILATGMFDHYWLTLVQNIWLLAIVLVLMGDGGKIAYVKKTDN